MPILNKLREKINWPSLPESLSAADITVYTPVGIIFGNIFDLVYVKRILA